MNFYSRFERLVNVDSVLVIKPTSNEKFTCTRYSSFSILNFTFWINWICLMNMPELVQTLDNFLSCVS